VKVTFLTRTLRAGMSGMAAGCSGSAEGLMSGRSSIFISGNETTSKHQTTVCASSIILKGGFNLGGLVGGLVDGLVGGSVFMFLQSHEIDKNRIGLKN